MSKLEFLPNQNEDQSEHVEPTLEEKAIVERIEKLNTDDTARSLILLTWQGLKPVSEFSFAKYDSKEDTSRIEDLRKLEELLQNLGLFYERTDEKLEGERFDEKGNSTAMNFHQDNYYIAKKKEDLKYFANHFGKPEDTEISEKLGTMLGYPPSAIEAWNATDRSATLLNTKEENPQLFAREEMAFARFRLSKQNWAEEFETIKKWAQAIKRLDPMLYERIIENRRRVLGRE